MGVYCILIGHRRDAARVWNDGQHYRAPCKRCGRPMIKASFAHWRLFDPAQDYDDTDGRTRKGRPTRRT